MRNVSHRLTRLNTWSQLGGAAEEARQPLGERALLEEIQGSRWDVESSVLPHFQVSLCLVFVIEVMFSHTRYSTPPLYTLPLEQ